MDIKRGRLFIPTRRGEILVAGRGLSVFREIRDEAVFR